MYPSIHRGPDVPAARMVLPLACVLLLTACSGANGGPPRDPDLPAGVSSHFAGLMTVTDPAAFRAAAAERGFVTTADGVVLDVQTRGLAPADRAAFDLPGLKLRGFHPAYERVDALAASPDAIRAVAALPFVRMVAPTFGATTGGSADGY